MTTTDLSPGLRRAAVTLLALGKGPAAKVLAELDEPEAAALTKALLAVGAVPADEIKASLVDLASSMGKLADVSAPQTQWVSEVLTDALGKEKAQHLVQEATRPEPFAWMRGAEVDTLVTVLSNESPATVAIVIAHLDDDLGGQLLRKLPDDQRDAVATRVAQLEVVPEASLRHIDTALLDQVGRVVSAPARSIDGVSRMAGLLGRVPKTTSEKILSALTSSDPKRAVKVREQMFTFNDVLALAAYDLQKVLAAVETRTLAISLHGASEAEVTLVFANLTERASVNLREELEFLGPTRAREVKNARREVVSVAGSLEAEGTISRPELFVDDEDEDQLDATTEIA